MITYELAKQLKNAGFPQATNGFYYWDRDLVEAASISVFYDEKIVTHTVKVPLLSELIEACGYEFDQLYRYVESEGERYVWGAHKVGATGTDPIIEKATPEEAVAALWLELNKN